MAWLRPMVGVILCSSARFLQRGQHLVQVVQQQVRRLLHLHRKAGVEHVGGRHALVHEARGRADMLGEVGQERDDVVLGLALDLVDAVDLPLALGFQISLAAFFGIDAEDPPARRRRGPRSRTRCGSGSPAPRSWSFRGGNSGESSGDLKTLVFAGKRTGGRHLVNGNRCPTFYAAHIVWRNHLEDPAGPGPSPALTL